jgi:hypothetical protein
MTELTIQNLFIIFFDVARDLTLCQAGVRLQLHVATCTVARHIACASLTRTRKFSMHIYSRHLSIQYHPQQRPRSSTSPDAAAFLAGITEDRSESPRPLFHHRASPTTIAAAARLHPQTCDLQFPRRGNLHHVYKQLCIRNGHGTRHRQAVGV